MHDRMGMGPRSGRKPPNRTGDAVSLNRTHGRLAVVVASVCALAACAASENTLPAPLEESPAVEPSAGQPAAASARAIDEAPAFAAELARYPTDGWLTNGGSLSNERFSPLDQIDRSNVADLKPEWRTNLGSGVGPRFSNEATPVVYDGVAYITTGENDVFAVDVETGDIIWTYQGDLPDAITTLCCAWNNRGVAIGEGMVFEGKLTGDLVGIDQQTGEEVWSADLGDWEKGQTITAAPLYYDGIVYSGVSGGEYGVRGRVYALDAKTGEELWRFWTVPDADEVGGDTWPEGGDARAHGGAVVWQTPTLDPELGLLYFGTSNPGPLYSGGDRPGKNLFSSSIVAIDAKSGEYVWHFQEVHHDLWDYDQASPTTLFDIEIDGQTRRAIAGASKTGFVYVLDRETGEPLLPIEERPVPQNDDLATWPTQPHPVGDSFVPQKITPSEAKALQDARTGRRQWEYVNGGKIFTVPSSEQVGIVAKPGTLGGANWPPASFNPETGYLYLCGSDTTSLFSYKEVEYEEEEIRAGRQFLGSAFDAPAGAQLKGTFTAMDMRTNRIAWQQEWNGTADNCYSGSVTTGGGLVFVGRNDGRLIAYDAADGDQLWEAQTGAGANAPAAVFEHDGQQHVLQLSGGNSLAGSPSGDILTLFSLDGKLDPAPAAGFQRRGPGGGRQ